MGSSKWSGVWLCCVTSPVVGCVSEALLASFQQLQNMKKKKKKKKEKKKRGSALETRRHILSVRCYPAVVGNFWRGLGQQRP
jgi:hypothetical protein